MNNKPTPETDEVAQPSSLLQYETVNANFARKLERERDEARRERDILRLNSLGTIQLNIPVTTDWKEETK
jgi:ABC-type nitrate/sulfonate/bicarbonate transport system ATPase subunit